ncbi:MAG: hypothetical protein ABI347_09295 [Nitrososphaera sp.]|jgi:hypothetical protein
MPAGTRVRALDLEQKLESLDIDEGIRIQSGRRKMFVNRRASGDFVVQLGGDSFRYLSTAGQVAKLVSATFRTYDAWAY